MGRGIPSDQSVNSNELEADQFEDDGQQVKNAMYDTNEYGKKLAEECAGFVLPDQEVQCSQECIGNVGGPAVLGGKKPARYFSNQMHNFDSGDLTDQAGLQNSESDYRLGQDSGRKTPGSNVITSLYNLLDPLELFRKGLSSCDSDRSKDRQTFNSIKSKLPAVDYTKESSDQKTLTDNTSECSTETKENVGENVNDGWGSWRVNQITGWPDENDGVRGASPNSEGYQSPDAGSNKGCSPLPDTDSDSSDGDSEECSSIDDDQTICTSDWGSDGDSSGSLDYFFPSEEDPPLMKLGIPLITDEERLVERFCAEMEGVRNENIEERKKSSSGFSSNYIENASKRVGDLLERYLSQGIRLNLPYNNVSNLVLDEIKDILYHAVDLTSGLRRRDYRIRKRPSKGELDNPNNIEAVVNVVRELFFKGGKVELNDYNDEPDYERFHKMVRKPMRKFIKEREQIYGVLKNAAYEGIVNKDAQGQEGDLVVDIDNCYFYAKYPQDSTIEVAKVVDGLKKVTNDLKIEELNFKYYIFHIGESIVRFEEDKDEKRNYTDVLQGSIEMSFATKVGKISVHLYSSSTETKDGKTENRGIKVEIDEESKTRFFRLEDEEKKSLGKNCLLEGKSVADIIAKSLEKNGDVPASSAKASGGPSDSMKQVLLSQLLRANEIESGA